MINMILKYKDPSLLKVLNMSFEYIKLFKPFDVNLDFDNSSLSISGEQSDWINLLTKLQEDFKCKHAFINTITCVYIQMTDDKSLSFITPETLDQIYKDWKSYTSKYLN